MCFRPFFDERSEPEVYISVYITDIWAEMSVFNFMGQECIFTLSFIILINF